MAFNDRKGKGIDMAAAVMMEKKEKRRTDDMQDKLSTGMSFDDAWVRYNSQLPEKPDTPAYIKGNQVEIGPGQEHHLPHELGHVVQQKLGIVRANAMHSSDAALNTDPCLEHPADEIGDGQRVDVIQKKADSVVQRALDGPRAIAANNLKKCVEEAYNILENIIEALNINKQRTAEQSAAIKAASNSIEEVLKPELQPKQSTLQYAHNMIALSLEIREKICGDVVEAAAAGIRIKEIASEIYEAMKVIDSTQQVFSKTKFDEITAYLFYTTSCLVTIQLMCNNLYLHGASERLRFILTSVEYTKNDISSLENARKDLETSFNPGEINEYLDRATDHIIRVQNTILECLSIIP